MPVDTDFITPSDKPALMAMSDTDFLMASMLALGELGYKIHSAESHEQFLGRFGQVQYQVILIEENFCGHSIETNVSLRTLQGMSMSLRRHATIILVGKSFQTFSPMQAFQQSVHAVANPLDSDNFKAIIQQVVHNNDMFLNTFRDVQSKMSEGKR